MYLVQKKMTIFNAQKLFLVPLAPQFIISDQCTGAASSQCVTPRGVRPFWGCRGGGGALVDPNLGGRRVGRSATGLPGGGGGVGGYPNIHPSK